MTNPASTSNPSCIVEFGEAYPYRSHIIGPNIVTVKMSGKNNYNLWRLQMECLLNSQHMVGFIDGQSPRPAGNGKEKVGDMEAWNAGDSLVKGWILGSLSEEVARKAVNHLRHMQKKTNFTAKHLWDELQCSYGPSVREQAAEKEFATRQAELVIQVISEYEDAESEIEVISEYEDAKSEIEVISEYEDAKSKDDPTEEKTRKEENKRLLYKYIIGAAIDPVMYVLRRDGLNPWDKFTNNGNTVLHVAVGSSTKNHELLKKLLELTPKENTLLDVVNSDGSSLLHVAAIGGNIEAVNMLVERNPELLLAKDKEGHTPLALSVSNMHFKTSHCLFEHMKEKGYGTYFSGKNGEDLVVLAISCQDFRLAKMIINDYPDAILSDSDAVLMALAQNFPRELNFWERGWVEEHERIAAPYSPIFERLYNNVDSSCCQRLAILIRLFALLFLGTVDDKHFSLRPNL